MKRRIDYSPGYSPDVKKLCTAPFLDYVPFELVCSIVRCVFYGHLCQHSLDIVQHLWLRRVCKSFCRAVDKCLYFDAHGLYVYLSVTERRLCLFSEESIRYCLSRVDISRLDTVAQTAHFLKKYCLLEEVDKELRRGSDMTVLAKALSRTIPEEAYWYLLENGFTRRQKFQNYFHDSPFSVLLYCAYGRHASAHTELLQRIFCRGAAEGKSEWIGALLPDLCLDDRVLFVKQKISIGTYALHAACSEGNEQIASLLTFNFTRFPHLCRSKDFVAAAAKHNRFLLMVRLLPKFADWQFATKQGTTNLLDACIAAIYNVTDVHFERYVEALHRHVTGEAFVRFFQATIRAHYRQLYECRLYKCKMPARDIYAIAQRLLDEEHMGALTDKQCKACFCADDLPAEAFSVFCLLQHQEQAIFADAK